MMLVYLAVFALLAAPLRAQEVVISRMPAATMRGTVVEVSCFRQQGAATVGVIRADRVREKTGRGRWASCHPY